MPARRRPKKARQARQALYRQLVLEAAERVFAEKGYEEAKMEEIALEAGLSLGTLYSVFSGKAEVFREIHEAGDAELLRRSVECVRGLDDPLEVVLAGVRAYVEYFLQHPDFLRMHLREGLNWGSEAAGRSDRTRTDAWRAGVERLTRAFARCIDEGIFVDGDPRLQARMMIAMQQVQLAHWIEQGATRPQEELVQDVMEQVRRSFVRRDAPSSGTDGAA